MSTKRTATVFFGFLVVLALVAPTIGASHREGVVHVWNDSGINTRLVENLTTGWNDAGFNTRLVLDAANGWNDLGVTVRRTENYVQGWSDAGTGSGLA